MEPTTTPETVDHDHWLDNTTWTLTRYTTSFPVPETLEAKILYDADKLDAIGAIGIGRTFVWTGKNNADCSDLNISIT